jgi:hypothetical protein
MRRFVIGLSAAALVLLGGTVAGSSVVQALAPDSAPAPTEGHPLVGAWMLTVDEFPEDPPSLVIFGADGTFEEVDADGAIGFGAWEATGPTSGNLTFVSMTPNEEGGFDPILTIRATGEVSADGQTFTAQFTIEFTAEGFPVGEFGPGNATGTRISVEPMGTPAGSLEDLLSQFEEGTEPPGVPTTAEPVGTEPATTEPTGTAPAGTEPAATEPAATEPAGTEPAVPTTEAGPETTTP